MKRREFLQISAAAALAANSGDLLGDAANPRKALAVPAGADRDNEPIHFLDAVFDVKASGKDTEGRCVIFDTVRHKKVGPALHLHPDCDEWFHVKAGEFKAQAGEKTLRLKAGDSLFIPRDTPHAFVMTSEGDGRLIVMHFPAARMEEYFRYSARQTDQSEAARKRVAEMFGIRVLGPPLTPD